MSLKSDNKSTRNGQVILNDDKKGPQKIKVILRRLLKRSHKRKMRRKKRKSTGRKRKMLSRATFVKDIQ